jgi:HK97 gp10 family phage protein
MGFNGARVTGFEELHRAFAELPKATGKNVLRRVANKALEPMRAVAEDKAPKLSGETAEGIEISPKKAKPGARSRGAGPQAYETSMGPTGIGRLRGFFQEFGTYKEPPQPFMRPAWDQEAGNTLETIKADLWTEIEGAAARVARKAARKAGKGG